MKTILVSKMGQSVSTTLRGSATGEIGDTIGTIRHLQDRGDVNVVFFGAARGEMPCKHITPMRSDDHTDWEQQEAGWASDVLAIREFDPIAYITICGPPATFSWIRNPKDTLVQATGVYYTAPILNILQQLKLPRICVNNDMRTYPREQEMSYGWTYVRPAAFLDQCTQVKSMTVGGLEYTRRIVYAACESWAWLPERESRADKPVRVISHCHVDDGIRVKGRADVWKRIITPGTEVFGMGWDAVGFDGECVPMPQAMDLFNRTAVTPCIPPADGYYTSKPFVALSQGCIPVPYGRGEPLTWDPYEYYVPLNAFGRCQSLGDLERVAEWVMRENPIEQYRAMFKKNFTVLDQVVDSLLDGTFKRGLFGGYELC